ncbi:hypothetical protein [Ruminococcus albus]|uniref:Uncharacterized protein n=1 Tax=Ruminococcus albus TaxID=1264 RepID=A0A1H7LPZ3_RUMAL|nr:hypothetical protein [Ruminococcus albus]SEL01033.1 hypothetical protein SAMN05216469_109112 [Ruminococcus albus]
MKKERTALIISTVTTLVLFIIAMVNYIQTGFWDTTLSGLIACNACICCCTEEKYRSAKKAQKQ